MATAEDKPVEIALDFKYVPGFAKFLLEERLDEICAEGLAVSREVKYPLLKFFEHLPEEQLLELSKTSNRKFYTHAINNTLDEQLRQSLELWKQNQLPLLSSDQLVMEDITLAGYVRRKVWMKFLKQYTTDVELAFHVLSELDEYQKEADTAAYRIFIEMQVQKMEAVNRVLRHNENLYKQAQELTHIGNWSWTPDDGKIHWSDEMYRIYGLEPQSEEIDIERFASFIHPEDRRTRIDQLKQSIETHDTPAYIMRIIKADGSIAVLSGNNEIIQDEGGKAISMLGTSRDITKEYYLSQELERKNNELQELNRSLESKNKELERSNKELSSFSYIASHDLQEPLRKIKTYSDLIVETESDTLPDQAKHYFNTITKSASRMQQLIQDILSFSQISTFSVEMKDVDLNITISEIVGHYDEQLRQQQLIIKVGKLPTVKGIPFQIMQLFQNLISNAIKYRKESAIPEIAITAELIGGDGLPDRDIDYIKKYHKIIISDNGIGFDSQYADKIFELFQRLHGRDEYSGTGVGLAICKKIIQNHGGHIYASGTPGVGSVFSVCLPQTLN